MLGLTTHWRVHDQELGWLFVPELFSLFGGGWELAPLPTSPWGPTKAPWDLLHGCDLSHLDCPSVGSFITFRRQTSVLPELLELS